MYNIIKTLEGITQMNCAVLYQKHKPPMIDGIDKPLKSGGYSDSGADISFSLKKKWNFSYHTC